MKIAILMPGYFEENIGGAELQAKHLAQIAAENRHNVYYIFLSTGKIYPNQLGINLFPVLRNKLANKIGNIKYLYALSVFKILQHIMPDVIYSRTGSALAGIGAFYARKIGVKNVFHIAHDRDVEPKKIEWSRSYLIPENKLIEYGIQKADIIIAQTEYQAKKIGNNYSREAIVIPNGHPQPLTKDFPKPKTCNHVIWIANWKPIKQPEVFIQLANRLSSMPEVSFTMVGRTDNYDWLQTEAEKAGIDVKGEVSNHQVNEMLSRCHILVNTSKQEGFSNTFIQAWMRMVPVVSLQVDPDNVLEKESIGFCSGSFDQLVKDTKRLIADDNLRNEMGERAKAYAMKNHSMKNMDKILGLVIA